MVVIIFFFKLYGDNRDRHVRTHSFPTRRSSDLGSPVWGPDGKQKVNGSSIFPKRLAGAVVDPAIGGALAMEQVDHLVFRQSGAVEQAGMAADRGAVGAPLDHADQVLVALLAAQALAAGAAEFGEIGRAHV